MIIEIRTGADLGRAIAELRRANGLTQEQLADQAGLARSYLARLEAGLSVLLLDRSLRLLRRLGATVQVHAREEAAHGPRP